MERIWFADLGSLPWSLNILLLSHPALLFSRSSLTQRVDAGGRSGSLHGGGEHLGGRKAAQPRIVLTGFGVTGGLGDASGGRASR